jgi:hypothetical protein
MGEQTQILKKQRKALLFTCGILALIVFVFGVYAFVQRGIAVENERMALEALKQTRECEKEAMRQKAMAEAAWAETLRARQEVLQKALPKK